MRKSMKTAVGFALAGIMGLAVPFALSGDNGQVFAGDHKHSSTPRDYNPNHHSVIRIKHSDHLPQARAIKLGLNKSTLVELPQELRDVVVSNPQVMDAVVQSSNRVYLIGKKIGQSNAFFFNSHGEQILTLEVSIERDVAVLDSLLRRLIPGSNVKAEILNETLILTGSVRNPSDSVKAAEIAQRFIVSPAPETHQRQALKVINLLAVEAEEQVMLKVTVAEVQRSILKQLGVNLGGNFSAGNFVTSLLTSNALPLTAAAGLGTLPTPGIATSGATSGTLGLYNSGPENTSTNPFGNSGVAGGWSGGRNSANYALRAMERDGLVRTLAEPNLTAVSGESAKFLAGGEFPIVITDSQGSQSVTFKEYGVGVTFTPIVQSEGRISLKIETEVSELSSEGSVALSGFSIPALKVRRANSTVELPSGGSVAMAGLISTDTRQNIDGLPGLKNLPVLGTLFRSREFIKNETELVVIVTPYMVKPTARQKLARPDDGLTPVSDREGNLLGHLNRIYGRGKSIKDGGLKGDYGFIVE